MPVISVALSGLWGSLFSRKDKNLLSRCPRKLLAKKYIDVAAPLPAEIGLTDMKTAIDSMKRMN